MVRPRRQREQAVSLGALLLRSNPPKLLGDERHEWMQQLEYLVAHPGNHGSGLVLRGRVTLGQNRLGKLEIPIAETVPDKTVHCRCSFVEPAALDRLGDFPRCVLG